MGTATELQERLYVQLLHRARRRLVGLENNDFVSPDVIALQTHELLLAAQHWELVAAQTEQEG